MSFNIVKLYWGMNQATVNNIFLTSILFNPEHEKEKKQNKTKTANTY